MGINTRTMATNIHSGSQITHGTFSTVPRASLGYIGAIALCLLLGTTGCNQPQQSAVVSSSVETSPAAAPPPLIEATLAGDLDQVRSQLAAGTDPNLVYHTNTALTYAARDGFTDIAEVLIDAGADVNWIDGEGVTPLILASFKGHVALTQLLLDHGADKTIIDQWNRTALDYALRRGENDEIVQMLCMH